MYIIKFIIARYLGDSFIVHNNNLSKILSIHLIVKHENKNLLEAKIAEGRQSFFFFSVCQL